MFRSHRNARRLGATLLGLALLACAAVSWLPHSTARASEGGTPVKIPTPRGVELVGDLHVPKTPNGVGVLLAPGQGYHRNLPLVARGAEALADAGFVVLRFDWAYFTAKEQVSDGYATEGTDLEAALAHLRAQDSVERVVLAGKSLGSLVAIARAARKHDDLAGLALLTLPIHGSPDDTQRWFEPAELGKADLPVLIVSGDADPICKLQRLYELAAGLPRSPRVVVVPGDHSLRPADKNEDATAQNVDLAVRALVLWARRWTQGASGR